MSRWTWFAILGLLAYPAPAIAQHDGASAQGAMSAPPEARQHDFLVGQWDLVIKVPPKGLAQKIHGTPRTVGTWKAWRAFDGFGVEDELRVTDAAGNPRALSVAMRYYVRETRSWSVATIDVYRSKLSTGTAEWKAGAMVYSSRGTDPDGKPFVSRSRFSDITPASFRFQQERSYDDGKTWTDGILTIEARRVAATAPR